MKLGLFFIIIAAVGTAACSDGGPDAPTGPTGAPTGTGTADDTPPITDDDAGGGGDIDASSDDADDGSSATFSTAAWLGNWSCTSGTMLNGVTLPVTTSSVVITSTDTNDLTIVSTTLGSLSPPCTLHATLVSDTSAVFPIGQACALTIPIPATLTLTPNSGAALTTNQIVTIENVVVSNNLAFNGQMGILHGTCNKS
jgi:hypothetical protein